jgi:hypothetical protein
MTIEQLLYKIAYGMTVGFYWKKLWNAHITPTERWKLSAISEDDTIKYSLTIFSYDVEKEKYPMTERAWECLGYLVNLLYMLPIEEEQD